MDTATNDAEFHAVHHFELDGTQRKFNIKL